MKNKSKKTMFIITVITALILIFPLPRNGAFADNNTADAQHRFQNFCQSVLDDNPGAVMVFDLKTRKTLAVVNPQTAYNTAYRPGSLFKLVTAAALLENNRVALDEEVECRNFFRVQGARFTCSEPGGHGRVNITKALGKSCSVYFYKTAPRISPDEITATAKRFSIGKAYDSADHPGIKGKGVCLAPNNPVEFAAFVIGDHDGIRITPWQAANVAAMIIAGRPLSNEIKAPVLKPITRKTLVAGMKYAARKGTCKILAQKGIDAGAKTGTSTHQHFKDKTHGWFIGYMPFNNPRYLAVVFLDDGRGYTDAAPMGAKILKRLKGHGR